MSGPCTPKTFILSDTESKGIKEALTGLNYDPTGSPEYIRALRTIAYQAFPGRLIEKLEELKSNDSSYCVFENLPIDEVYGSPLNEADSLGFKNGHLSENIIMAFGSIIAEPYSIHFEGKKIVNDLTPHKNTTSHYTGIGSEVELDFHIENAAQAYDVRGDTSPLALLLFGLRSDPNTKGPKTFVADARQALQRLTEQEIETLYGKHFIIRQPYRWRSHHVSSRDTILHPLLTGPLEQPRVTVAFYPDMVIPVDEEASSAYKKFYDCIRDVSQGVDIQPGKLVYVNNRFTLHSREKFSPTFDSNGAPYRWVQRVFLTNNLWNFRSFHKHGHRIFDPSIKTSLIHK
ncbi:TauD/TfdA family dioxygenase [Pseudomonas frederiksbergensis]|uniref:TauD/TfdA family dioxygenase n=1 Tax=Pseudomonas frederiksbergensis TaxID=104087 RepID=UPI003D196DCD